MSFLNYSHKFTFSYPSSPNPNPASSPAPTPTISNMSNPPPPPNPSSSSAPHPTPNIAEPYSNPHSDYLHNAHSQFREMRTRATLLSSGNVGTGGGGGFGGGGGGGGTGGAGHMGWYHPHGDHWQRHYERCMRRGRGGNGFRRLIWFGIGAGAATYYFKHKSHSQAQRDIHGYLPASTSPNPGAPIPPNPLHQAQYVNNHRWGWDQHALGDEGERGWGWKRHWRCQKEEARAAAVERQQQQQAQAMLSSSSTSTTPPSPIQPIILQPSSQPANNTDDTDTTDPHLNLEIDPALKAVLSRKELRLLDTIRLRSQQLKEREAVERLIEAEFVQEKPKTSSNTEDLKKRKQEEREERRLKAKVEAARFVEGRIDSLTGVLDVLKEKLQNVKIDVKIDTGSDEKNSRK